MYYTLRFGFDSFWFWRILIRRREIRVLIEPRNATKCHVLTHAFKICLLRHHASSYMRHRQKQYMLQHSHLCVFVTMNWSCRCAFTLWNVSYHTMRCRCVMMRPNIPPMSVPLRLRMNHVTMRRRRDINSEKRPHWERNKLPHLKLMKRNYGSEINVHRISTYEIIIIDSWWTSTMWTCDCPHHNSTVCQP